MSSKTQQALIQLLESMAITALIAGLFSIGTILAGNGPIDWRQVGIAFGLAVAFSLAHSLATYFKASNQVELGTAIEAVIDAIEQRFGALAQPITPDQAPMAPNRTTMLNTPSVVQEHPPD